MNTMDTQADMSVNQALNVLQSTFGYDDFRGHQSAIIDNLLNQQNTLAIMPTGGGKSICYQIPALLFDGLTVVISPLISLMEDQVRQLHGLDIPAALLNSTLSTEQYQQTIDAIEQGQIKLLFLAPETALQANIIHLFSSINVACLAIDEAHCISEWGHEFRPEYRQIGQVIEVLNNTVIVALTATATPRVRADIKQQLMIAPEHEFISSFDRSNLYLSVVEKDNPYSQCLKIIEQHAEQSGIIYCQSKKAVNELSEKLQVQGIKALPYHAGLNSKTRSTNQSKFVNDDVQIIVATIAFGMGINKPDVRFVIHYDLPKNIESYYQQIGRAGRDGLDAKCVLLFGYGDTSKIRYFIDMMQNEDEKRLANMHLGQILAFAETEDCRRIPLLGYFDEQTQSQTCGQCDNCLFPNKDKTDLSVPAQKFLSCILRSGQRFGASHIIDVLRGSNAEKILQNQHNLLSTYNIGKEFSKKQWASLSRKLIQKGFIKQDEQFGSLKITLKGAELLKGNTQFHAVIVEENARTAGKTQQAHDLSVDETLLQILKSTRKALADAANVPPYAVFSDKSLQEMAHFFPHSTDSFLKIHGVGQAKLDKYADTFISLITEHCAEHDIQEQQNQVAVKASAKSSKTTGIPAKTREIGTRFNKGESISSLISAYKVKKDTIVLHLDKYFDAGNMIQSKDALIADLEITESLLHEVNSGFEEHGLARLKPIHEHINGQLAYEDINLMRLYFKITKSL